MKYGLRKLLLIFTALCASCLMFSVCISASTDSGITASSANLAQGMEFGVSVVIPEAADASNLSVQVNFDSEAFEVISWKPEIPNGAYNSGEDFFMVAAAGSSRSIKLENGLILTAQMRVKDTAQTGLYGFSLTKGSVSFYEDSIEDYVELWDPEVLTITVSVDPENAPINEPDDEDEGAEIIEIDDDTDDDEDDDSGDNTDDDSDEMIIIPGDDEDDEAVISDGNGGTKPSGGNKSPSTGVGVACLIPVAVAGCVILAKKTPEKRFRPKSRKNSKKKKETPEE